MTTATREKLLEATYFLECMKKTQSDRDAFKYNLSAFLSAARSITLIMQKEFDKVSGFKEWYAEKRDQMRKDQIMNLLNDKRTMTIHQQSVRPHAHVNISLMAQSVCIPSISIRVIRADGTFKRRESEPMPLPKPAKAEVTTEWRWYFHELPEKDVITICEEHKTKLEAFVVECESRFTFDGNGHFD